VETTQKSENLSFEKVWLMFQETDKRFQETDKQLKENSIQLKETRAILNEQFKETDRIIRNLSNKMNESETRWGKFVEALVEGKLIEMMNERGIPVNLTLMRIKRKYEDEDYEIDIIAKNGKEIVVVEVKTTLGIEDVRHFIDKLKIFKTVIPEYSDNIIYGAVAFIQQDSEAQKYAAKKGLLVIKAVGEGAKIINRSNFKPKVW